MRDMAVWNVAEIFFAQLMEAGIVMVTMQTAAMEPD